MMTAKTTVVLVLAYVLALAAGTTSGVLAERLHKASYGPAAPLAEQLQLSQDQCDKMRVLWQSVSGTMDECYRQADQLERQRDVALVKLLSSQQKAEFAVTDRGFAAQYAALTERRDQVFRDALQQTEALLTPEQRVKYEQIVQARLGTNPPGTNGQSQSLELIPP